MSGPNAAMQRLEALCTTFGMSVEVAIEEKRRELELRAFLLCIPDWRVKDVGGFVELMTGKKATEEMLEHLVRRGRDRNLTEDEAVLLEERQNGRCAVCGRFLTRSVNPHVDHKIPVVFGGKSELGNYQLLCAECNLGKGHLLDWLMGAPFFIQPSATMSSRLRYCVLKRWQGGCAADGCENHPMIAEMRVVPRVPAARGGRAIFDNLVCLCAEHADQVAAATVKSALQRARQGRYGVGNLKAH